MVKGILEGLFAGLQAGGSYVNYQDVIDALSDRVENGIGIGGWQSAGYATYALSLVGDASALTSRNILAGWINDGYFDTGEGAYLEGMGEALLGLASAVAPVPEPAPLALLGFGLIGLGFMRKRNAK